MWKLDNLFQPIVTNTFIENQVYLCYQEMMPFLNMSDASFEF